MRWMVLRNATRLGASPVPLRRSEITEVLTSSLSLGLTSQPAFPLLITLHTTLSAALLEASLFVSLSKHPPTLNRYIGQCPGNNDYRLHPIQDASDGFDKAIRGYAADFIITYETQTDQG